MSMSPGETLARPGRVRIAAATVPGAVHLRRGRPNQDAIGWLPASGEGERLVMAVSDGHGDTASPRSHHGSRIAVDVATRLLWSLPAPLTEQILREAVPEIAGAWRREVQEHLDRNPLSGVEIGQGAAEPAARVPARLRERPILAYGTTLVFAVIDADQVGLGQLGDGDILLVSGPGDTYRPLPPDARLMGHTTTSLCDDDPLDSTRLAVLSLTSRLVILSTDGYANSFADDASFLQVGTDLLTAVETTGITGVRQSLPTWLAETSQQGAGDDISVTVALTALSDAPAQSLPSPDAARPAARPVQVRPVRPVKLTTERLPHVGDTVAAQAERSPERVSRLSAARPAADDPFPSGSVPARDQQHGTKRGAKVASVLPEPPPRQHPAGLRGAIVTLLVLATVLGAALGAYALLGKHRTGKPPPTQPSRPAPSRSAGPPVPVTVSWVLSDDRRTVERHTGATVEELALPSPARKLLPVPAGALLLLANGQVGLLPPDRTLSIDGWPTENASDIVCEHFTCYLLDGSRNRVRAINPRTGVVSPLLPGKGPAPFGPPASTYPLPSDGGPSEGSSGNLTVRMPDTAVKSNDRGDKQQLAYPDESGASRTGCHRGSLLPGTGDRAVPPSRIVRAGMSRYRKGYAVW